MCVDGWMVLNFIFIYFSHYLLAARCLSFFAVPFGRRVNSWLSSRFFYFRLKLNDKRSWIWLQTFWLADDKQWTHQDTVLLFSSRVGRSKVKYMPSKNLTGWWSYTLWKKKPGFFPLLFSRLMMKQAHSGVYNYPTSSPAVFIISVMAFQKWLKWYKKLQRK